VLNYLRGLAEAYLAARVFIGRNRSLIPLVDEIIEAASERAVELVMGMSHRGRLNVIVQLRNAVRRRSLRDSKMSTRAACSAAAMLISHGPTANTNP